MKSPNSLKTEDSALPKNEKSGQEARNAVPLKPVEPSVHSEPGLKRWRFALMVVIPVLLLSGLGAWYLAGGRYVSTDNAYIKAKKVLVSAQITGLVKELYVSKNQRVRKGDKLFKVEPIPFEILVQKAEAELSQVATDLQALKARYSEKEAEIELAMTQAEYARKEWVRQKGLARQEYISPSLLADAEEKAAIARQKVNVLEQELAVIEQSLGGDVNRPVEEHPRYLEALSELQFARMNLARVNVLAPFDGVVANVPEIGQFVASGQVALALVSHREFKVEANFTETDLEQIHEGQPVVIEVDAYPGHEWHGEVLSIGPATGSEFSIIPAQNATGNWVKISQRVPVQIGLQYEEGMPQLRSGMSATVTVDTGAAPVSSHL